MPPLSPSGTYRNSTHLQSPQHLIPSDSSTTLPRNLHGQAVKTQPFLVPQIRDPRSTVLLKSTLEVWWLRSGGRSKRLGFPWWNCWMKQSPKFSWMNQSPNYPSGKRLHNYEKSWTSLVGMMTFHYWMGKKMFQTTNQQIVHKVLAI